MIQITAGLIDVAGDAADHADALIALGRYEEALSSIGRGLILTPSDNRLHCQRALARQRLARFRESARSAGEAISANPDEPWGYDLKASALSAQARSSRRPWRHQYGRQARDAAGRAVQLAPADAMLHCTAAEAELLAGDWPAAQAAAQRALALAPTRPEPYIAVAQVALASRDYLTAQDAARRALAIDPSSYAATNHLGSALVGLCRWRQAAATFTAAARLDPQAQPARRNLVRLGTATIGSVAVGIWLLLLLAPYGLVLFPLVGLGAGAAIPRSVRLRRRFDNLALGLALGLGRLPLPGGVAAAAAMAAAVGATLTGLTLAVGVGVAGPALLVAGAPVAAGLMVARGVTLLRLRRRRSRVGRDLPVRDGLQPTVRSPLSRAPATLVALAAAAGWIATGLIALPYLAVVPVAAGRPGGRLVALIPGLLALWFSTVAAARLWRDDRRGSRPPA